MQDRSRSIRCICIASFVSSLMLILPRLAMFDIHATIWRDHVIVGHGGLSRTGGSAGFFLRAGRRLKLYMLRSSLSSRVERGNSFCMLQTSLIGAKTSRYVEPRWMIDGLQTTVTPSFSRSSKYKWRLPSLPVNIFVCQPNISSEHSNIVNL